MELTNDFRVGVPVERAWEVLTDVERIAPCMPGAELQEVEGEEFRGIVKVKVGPITAQYKGKATFVERDQPAGRVVLRAEGRDTRGQGNANATITATMTADGDGTKVSVVTDLAVTGKVAQFGRGVLAEVSAKLLTQFVECLEADVLAAPVVADPADAAAIGSTGIEGISGVTAKEAEHPPASAPKPASQGPEVRRIDSRPAQPVDLLQTAGGSVARRIVPAVAAFLALAWIIRRLLD